MSLQDALASVGAATSRCEEESRYFKTPRRSQHSSRRAQLKHKSTALRLLDMRRGLLAIQNKTVAHLGHHGCSSVIGCEG